MLMPPVSRYMSRQPWTITRDATIAQAHQMMRDHRIRHLPVVDQTRLVGIVSERDLYLVKCLPGADAKMLTIDKAMSSDVYSVGPDEPIDVVVEEMAKRRLGSVVVIDRRGGVDGIFTSIDALEVLADVLHRVTA